MPAFNVDATIEINSPVQPVIDALVDFNTWPIWSPWLYTEREASVTCYGTPGDLGHGYDWVGEKVGAGGMTLKSRTEQRIECDLKFLKPFKSQAGVAFDLKELGANKTRISWTMQSSLPFFMFWMVGSISAMIKSDYQRGLRLLKDYLELDSIPSKTLTMGPVDVPAALYVGIKGSAPLATMADAMSTSFRATSAAAIASNATQKGSPFTLYTRMDIKRGQCDYTAALPITASVQASPPAMVSERSACRAMKVTHTGAYRHLGNAWSTLMAELRQKKIKQAKRLAPFECYLNDPDTTREEDLITEIYMPLRS